MYLVLKMTFKTSPFMIISSIAANSMLSNVRDELVIVTVGVQFDFTKTELQFAVDVISWLCIVCMYFVHLNSSLGKG